MAIHVLLIEPDPFLRESARFALSCEGLQVVTADAGAALNCAHDIDLLIVDVMAAPGGVGALCRRLRERPRHESALVLLTAEPRVSGPAWALLEETVDALLIKPFGTLELTARVHALLRRRRGVENADAEEMEATPRRVGDLELDPSRRLVRLGDRDVKVTELEFRLLYLLAGEPGRVFPRRSLLDQVWGENRHVTFRSVDVLVKRLRRRIGSNCPDTSYLETIRGVGYRMTSQERRDC